MTKFLTKLLVFFTLAAGTLAVERELRGKTGTKAPSTGSAKATSTKAGSTKAASTKAASTKVASTKAASTKASKSSKASKAPTQLILRITNLSFNQPFGGFFVAMHNAAATPLFVLGTPASPELADLAENGSPASLVDLYNETLTTGVGQLMGFATGAPYPGGAMFDIPITLDPAFPLLTVASMAINTNDCFVSVNGQPISVGTVFSVPGYDSGSENNNENCDFIPGPACPAGGTNLRSEPGEGFVHVHRGVFGIANLTQSVYDWRNPMMRLQVLAAP